MYVLFCIFCFHRANWHSSATLTEIFPRFFLICKTNSRVYFTNTGHGLYSSQLVNCVVLHIVYVDCVVPCILCVLMCTTLLPLCVNPIAVKNICTNIIIYKYLCFSKEDILTHEKIELYDCSVYALVLIFIDVGFESS